MNLIAGKVALDRIQAFMEASATLRRISVWRRKRRPLYSLLPLRSLHEGHMDVSPRLQPPANPAPTSTHPPQAEEMRQAAPLPPAAPGQPAVELRGASFAWSPGMPPLLHDINLTGACMGGYCQNRRGLSSTMPARPGTLRH